MATGSLVEGSGARACDDTLPLVAHLRMDEPTSSCCAVAGKLSWWALQEVGNGDFYQAPVDHRWPNEGDCRYELGKGHALSGESLRVSL